MAGNSAVTWDEVAAMVSNTQALWKNGAMSGKSCLTWADFRAKVINNGSGSNTNSLITLNEFNNNKIVAAQIKVTLNNYVGDEIINLDEYVSAGQNLSQPTRTAAIGRDTWRLIGADAVKVRIRVVSDVQPYTVYTTEFFDIVLGQLYEKVYTMNHPAPNGTDGGGAVS